MTFRHDSKSTWVYTTYISFLRLLWCHWTQALIKNKYTQRELLFKYIEIHLLNGSGKITLKDDYSQTVSYCCATALCCQVFTPSFAFSPYSVLQPCWPRNLIHTIQIEDWEWSSWAGSQAWHSLEVSLQPSIKLLMLQCLHLSLGTLGSSYLARMDEMS